MNSGGACPALLPRAGADRGWTGSLGPLLGTGARRDRCRADLPYAEWIKRKLVEVVLFSILLTGLSSVRPKRRRVLNRPFKTSWCAPRTRYSLRRTDGSPMAVVQRVLPLPCHARWATCCLWKFYPNPAAVQQVA